MAAHDRDRAAACGSRRVPTSQRTCDESDWGPEPAATRGRRAARRGVEDPAASTSSSNAAPRSAPTASASGSATASARARSRPGPRRSRRRSRARGDRRAGRRSAPRAAGSRAGSAGPPGPATLEIVRLNRRGCANAWASARCTGGGVSASTPNAESIASASPSRRRCAVALADRLQPRDRVRLVARQLDGTRTRSGCRPRGRRRLRGRRPGPSPSAAAQARRGARRCAAARRRRRPG